MKVFATACLALAAAVWGSAAFADVTEGKLGGAAASPRAATVRPLPARANTPRLRDGLDVKALRDAARARQGGDRDDTTTSRSRDGTVRRSEAGPAAPEPQEDGRAGAPAASPSGFETAGRAIVGKDTRIRIQDTTDYPFSAIGLLIATFEDGGEQVCSGSLVGPRTVLTAASCLYRHDLEDPWFQELTFWPGANGEDDLPFGGYDYDDAHIRTAFIDNYDGTYGSIWEHDIGLVELMVPVGDDLGWLATRRSTNIGKFDANLVGYHSDMPFGTMWRSKCTVHEVDIYELDILHACDTYGDETWGAPLYIYYGTDKPRRLTALHLGTDNAGTNFALLLTERLAAWIRDHAQ